MSGFRNVQDLGAWRFTLSRSDAPEEVRGAKSAWG